MFPKAYIDHVAPAQQRLSTPPDDIKASAKSFIAYLEAHVVPAFDTFELYTGSEHLSDVTHP